MTSVIYNYITSISYGFLRVHYNIYDFIEPAFFSEFNSNIDALLSDLHFVAENGRFLNSPFFFFFFFSNVMYIMSCSKGFFVLAEHLKKRNRLNILCRLFLPLHLKKKLKLIIRHNRLTLATMYRESCVYI